MDFRAANCLLESAQDDLEDGQLLEAMAKLAEIAKAKQLRPPRAEVDAEADARFIIAAIRRAGGGKAAGKVMGPRLKKSAKIQAKAANASKDAVVKKKRRQMAAMLRAMSSSQEEGFFGNLFGKKKPTVSGYGMSSEPRARDSAALVPNRRERARREKEGWRGEEIDR